MNRPLVGIGVLVLSSLQPGSVLVGVRKGSHGSGTIALPGGHLDFGEEWSECGVREVKEETNLDIGPGTHVFTSNNVFPHNNKHYITLFMRHEVLCDSAPLETLEPDKCEGWSWRDFNQLKQQLRDGIIDVFPPFKTLLMSNYQL